jgi:hypothetical protein
MIPRTIAITALLSVAAALQAVLAMGSNGLLFLAIVGPAAVFLLPPFIVLALPAGAFGGILFTHADRATVDEPDEHAHRDAVRLAVLATIVSTVMVGWLVPQAGQPIEAAFSRFQDNSAQVAAAVSPARLSLDELVLAIGSVPGAGQELLRRVAWIAASLLMPLFATLLVAVKRRWTYGAAAAATLAVFGVFVGLMTGRI